MQELKHSKVYRCGLTETQLRLETEASRFTVKAQERSVNFEFDLDSKGGGVTSVMFQVGLADISAILNGIADQSPEEVLLLLSPAIKAVKNLRTARCNTQNVAKKMEKKIEKIKDFASMQRGLVSCGDGDKDERKMYSLILEVMDDFSKMQA